MVKFTCSEDIKKLKYKRLQQLAKQNKITANQKRGILINLLTLIYFPPPTSSKRIRIVGHNIEQIT